MATRNPSPSPTPRLARAFCTALAAAVVVACGDGPSAPAAPTQGQDAIRGVLDLFRGYRVVALQEAHELQEQMDFVEALVQRPEFAERVGAIAVEFGNARSQAVLDAWLLEGRPLPDSVLRQVWRNNSTSPLQQWDAPVYERFFRTIRAVNGRLPRAQRVRVLLGDPAFDWASVRGPADVLPLLFRRDSALAALADTAALRKGARVLIIAGVDHLLKAPTARAPATGAPPPPTLVPELLAARYPGAVYTIMPHIGFDARTAELEARIGDVRVPQLIPLASHWLGDLDGGFLDAGVFKLASGTLVRLFAGQRAAALADAYLYLGPRDALTRSVADPAIYRDSAYATALRDRAAKSGLPFDLQRLVRPRSQRFADNE